MEFDATSHQGPSLSRYLSFNSQNIRDHSLIYGQPLLSFNVMK